MTDGAERLQRLAAYIERRIAELGLEYAEVARLAGFSIEVLRKMRLGITVRSSTYRKLERALQWAYESVDAILSGGEPTPLSVDAAIENAAELYAERRAAIREAEEAQVTGTLSPSEALRRVVRSSAKELGVTPEGVNEVMRLVRRDLEEAESSAPKRTDLSDLVRVRRAEVGLSLEAVAAASVEPGGERRVEADWLDRLERAALGPEEYPEYPQLDALVGALHLDPAEVQEAAGVQFLDVHTTWSDDGQVQGLVEGELSDEDAEKTRVLMSLYRKAPQQRRDG